MKPTLYTNLKINLQKEKTVKQIKTYFRRHRVYFK